MFSDRSQISAYLDFGALKTLTGVLIQCHLDCACCPWSDGISKASKNKPQPSQNNLVRIGFLSLWES